LISLGIYTTCLQYTCKKLFFIHIIPYTHIHWFTGCLSGLAFLLPTAVFSRQISRNSPLSSSDLQWSDFYAYVVHETNICLPGPGSSYSSCQSRDIRQPSIRHQSHERRVVTSPITLPDI
jgi:hypothetical protein